MDRYKASIESVDSALNRLNQTLASYKLLLSESSQSSSANPADSSQKAVPTTQHTTETAPRNAKIAGSNGQSSLRADAQATQPSDLPEEGLVDDLLRSLRSSHRYPEVRTSLLSKANKGSADSSLR